MAQPFSDETRYLLDRAQQAIDDSIRLCTDTRRYLAEAERRQTFRLELAASEQRPQLHGPGK